MNKPTFLDRAVAVVSPVHALERAIARDRLRWFGYDAANPGTLRGGSGGAAKNGSPESARNSRDRVKLMWDARDLESNMPIIRCVLDRMAQQVCSRIRFHARVGTKEENSLFESVWLEWAEERADVSRRYDFRTLVELAFRAALRDGDAGANFVDPGDGFAMQLIEADRIGDPAKAANTTDESYISGIQIDVATGRPIEYDLFRRTRNNQYLPDIKVPADRFIHLTIPTRYDEYRTVSWLCAILGQARDLYEAFAYERGAAKWAASIAGIIRTPAPLGGGNPSIWDGTQTTNGTKTLEAQANKLLALQAGQDVTVFQGPARPSGSFQALIELTLQDIARGLNVPYGFFDMARLGGATSRLEAQQLQRTIARFQHHLTVKLLNPTKNRVFAEAIAAGKLPALPFWKQGRWSFGSSITADAGYAVDSDLALLRNGLKSGSAICAEYTGDDLEDVTEELANEGINFRNVASQTGVPIELIAPDRYINPTQTFADAATALEPPPPPDVSTLGENAVKHINEVQTQVSTGQLPPDKAIAALVALYGFDQATAALLIPAKPLPQPKPDAPSNPPAKPERPPRADA